jgi:imidazole glycerol-phosphate synthase subunit HisF
MYRPRLIPCLLMENDHLIKTVRFGSPVYIGDPINAVKIFNDKGADEVMIMDRSAHKKGINIELLKKISVQAFMPLGYAGGINSFADAANLFNAGYEKISINGAMRIGKETIARIISVYGSQSVIMTIDVKRDMWKKYKVYDHTRKKMLNTDPLTLAREAEELGFGEIVMNDADNDGLMKGYDYELIERISSSVTIPLVSLGGAGSIEDTKAAIKAGASAAGAGSLFVFYDKERAVLINYPGEK